MYNLKLVLFVFVAGWFGSNCFRLEPVSLWILTFMVFIRLTWKFKSTKVQKYGILFQMKKKIFIFKCEWAVVDSSRMSFKKLAMTEKLTITMVYIKQ